MEKVSFTVNSKVDLPKKVVIKEVLDKILLLDPDAPKWISLDKDEFVIYQLLENNTILESMKIFANEYSASEEHCIVITTKVLEKINDSDFYLNNEGNDEEDISCIKKNLQINVTSDCNIRCKHCYVAAGINSKKEINRDHLIRFIDTMPRNRLDNDIVLSGGEPLLHSELRGIVEDLKKREFNVILFSNGTLISEDNISFIKENVSSIQLSMEGVTEKYFELVRGTRTYKKFIDSLNLLKENGIKIILAVTVIDNVIEDIEENLIDFVNEFNYENIEIRINADIEKTGNAQKLPDSFFKENDTRRSRVNNIIRRLTNLGYNFKSSSSSGNRFKNCGIGASIVINSDGTIYPCNEFSFSENIKINSLDATGVFDYFDELNRSTSVERMQYCSKCEVRFVCCGGCKLKNKHLNGDYLIPLCDKDTIYRKLVLDEI